MNNAAAPRKVSFSFCAHRPACRGLARPAPSNGMMSIRIYSVEEEACVKTQCIQPSSVADLPMDRDDNRGPDWRRTRRLRVRACDIDGLLGLSLSCSLHFRGRDCGLHAERSHVRNPARQSQNLGQPRNSGGVLPRLERNRCRHSPGTAGANRRRCARRPVGRGIPAPRNRQVWKSKCSQVFPNLGRAQS
jgi:hypothetical protein